MSKASMFVGSLKDRRELEHPNREGDVKKTKQTNKKKTPGPIEEILIQRMTTWKSLF